MVKLKQNFKLIGVIVLSFGAVFICTLFMNYGLDLKAIESLITGPVIKIVYDGQKSMSSVIIAAAGGVMGATALVVLMFAVGRFISENQSNMGVLKALGHSELKIALSFLKFGISVFCGAVLGCAAGYAFCPVVYKIFNNGELPDVVLKFNFPVVIYLVIIPTVLFSLIAFFYALIKLKKPPLHMIHGIKKTKANKLSAKLQNKENSKPFLKNLKTTMLFNNLTLIFFVCFAGFGFSAQIQIGFLMRDVNMDFTFSAINFAVGIILGLVTLLLALSYILNSNRKYISMLKAYGYSDKECGYAMFGGYRIVSYIGFAIGSVYQFFFMKFMVSLFAGAYDVVLKFNVEGFFITLAAFVFSYEIIMFFYKRKIAQISLKEIMQA